MEFIGRGTIDFAAELPSLSTKVLDTDQWTGRGRLHQQRLKFWRSQVLFARRDERATSQRLEFGSRLRLIC